MLTYQSLAEREQSINKDLTQLEAKATIVTINVLSYNIGKYSHTIKLDVVNETEEINTVLRRMEGVFNHISKLWTIEIKAFFTLKAKVELMSNVNLNFKIPSVKQALQEYWTCPRWTFKLDSKYIIGKIADRFKDRPDYLLSSFAGVRFNATLNYYEYPLTEPDKLVSIIRRLEVAHREKFSVDDAILKLVADKEAKVKELEYLHTAEDVDLYVPLANDLELRPFQKVAVKFGELTNYRFIDADEMGLGKSPTSIACTIHNPSIKKVLIICPAMAKLNWVREVKKFTNMQPNVIVDSTPSTADIAVMLEGRYKYTIINYNLLATLTKYEKDGQLYERYLWPELINNIGFDCIIIDEAHYIKNIDSNRSVAARMLVAPHIIPLTGTPVINRPKELWPMMNMLDPKIFPDYNRFIIQYTEPRDKNKARNVEELRRIMKPYMIRRLKRDVKKDLPPIERVVKFYQLPDKARKVYEKVLKGIYQDVTGAEYSVTSVLAQITRMKQVCAVGAVPIITDFAKELFEDSEGDDYRKVLIGSQFKFATESIASQLGDEALWITGDLDMHERMRIVDRFQTDIDINYLAGTMPSISEALTITAAGSVINADLGWTPAQHMQFEGRAYGRENDSHSITSYYFVAEDTIMTWIWELLETKMVTIKKVADGEQIDYVDDNGTALVMEIIKRLQDGEALIK